jgi:hypothetical protein
MLMLFMKLIPLVLYFLVGVVSLLMAFKGLFAKKFLPFHEQAAGRVWDGIEQPMRSLILSFMRITGLGFLIMSVLLMVFAIVNYFRPDAFYEYFIPLMALIYCAGLFVINYILYIKTKADTPWKKSLFAMSALLAGIIISVIG